MILESTDRIHQSAAKVYETVRDHLKDLAPYLPNVDRIEVESRKKTKAGAKIVNRWYAKVELGALLSKVLNPELLSWRDHATWHDGDLNVTFELESPIAKNLFTAKGVNTFRPVDGHPDQCDLTVSCDIELHPENVPGVPKMIASKIVPAVEVLLKKMIEPNLMSLAKGLKNYYHSEKSRS